MENSSGNHYVNDESHLTEIMQRPLNFHKNLDGPAPSVPVDIILNLVIGYEKPSFTRAV